MKKNFITSRGVEVRTLSDSEIEMQAELGDQIAKKTLLKKQLEGAKSDTEKLNLVIAFLTEGV